MRAVIPRYFVVAEATHEIQNPTSEEKLLLLGEASRARARTRAFSTSRRGVAGRLCCSPASSAARGTASRSRRTSTRSRSSAPQRRGSPIGVTFELGDAATATHEPESYDAALCLGASFVYGSLADTVDALAPAVRPGGHVVVGEPYWRRLPLPEDYEDRTRAVDDARGDRPDLRDVGLPVVSVIASSEDDWDRYETLHWQAVERWLAENADDRGRAPRSGRATSARSGTYLRHERDYLGWAIFVGWKRP